jgi:hypothetical protein
MTRAYVNRGKDKTNLVKSQIFNYDAGAAASIDECVLISPRSVKLLSANMVEDLETGGTLTGTAVMLGTTGAGVDIVASVVITSTQAIGTRQALTLLKTIIPPNTPIFIRFTAIAATVAGQGHLQLEYQEW